MAIDDASLERVRRAADIVAVVGEYVQLKRRGQSYVGLCPFHEEKTPSFNVHAARQFYHCFGCGVGGDVFSFVMELEKMDFLEAVRHLARKFNVEITETADRTGDRRGERDDAYRVLERATTLYQRLLTSPAGVRGRDFLTRRKVSAQMQAAFGLGYAPPEWDFLAKRLPKDGVRPELLLTTGLCTRGKSGGLYDRLRDRLVFPVRDPRGRVVGFGGRDLSDAQDVPKYVNSPESPIYHKGSELYGLDLARKSLRDSPALLVEGYLDVVSLHGAGFAAAVAPLGTALTEEQAKLLGRFAAEKGVVVLFDGDAAGQAAALRSLLHLVNAGLAVRVATPPSGRDPDDVIRDDGPAALSAILDAAVGIEEFLTKALLGRHRPEDALGRGKLVEELAGHLFVLKGSMARDVLIDRFADKLGVSNRSLREDLRRAVRETRAVAGDRAAPVRRVRPVPLEQDVRLLLFLLFNDRERAGRVVGEIHPADFPESVRPAVEPAYEAVREGNLADVGPAAAKLEPAAREAFFRVMAMELDEEEREKALVDCLDAFRRRNLGTELIRLKAELKDAYRKGDEERYRKLLARIDSLKVEEG
ncbi:MAG: DNA primase [Candidatus Coatesbacteria bacterium RBG_13_66_14]|uniref:DNA primase n=1 Tax=Candidatus Coatesbacteria bacterium RBG_13_66_14 TaxID=1817816 RepID=A0A1F5F2Q7_9BACT|nr:MAG: DNA primase [Candidatus Coatesbacteria bacterium RBG_13_66_14]